MIFFYLILIRFLDYYSTYLCMAKYDGWESVEMVPLSRYLIGKLGYLSFLGVNFLIYLILLAIVYHFCEPLKYKVLNVMALVQTLVVIMNLLIFIWV